ncbi:MAG TPA: hypothetical protein VMF58_13040, partial [Rhizomicrobium sp.]|nr:hypothetical protein [Rhizomicrobium sp.]
MSVVETLYAPVRHRAIELGCAMPDGIAVLPENFCESQSRLSLLVQADSIALRNLFEDGGAPLQSFFPLGEHTTSGHGNGLAWTVSLFVPATVTARDPDAVARTISRISAHLADIFKGHPEKRIALVIVVEQNDASCRKLTY